jgi:RNA polymerase sigma factor (sigma-70 family)
MSNSSIHFQLLYNQYKVLVYNVALHYVQNIEDAEEITQDVFVQVHQSMDKFKNNSSIKTWIYRITINKSLDFIKYKKSKKRLFIFGSKSDSEKELNSISTFEHPGIALELQENAKILFGVIDELTENQRTAFILSKLDGLSNPEIADIMQLSISSVESLVFRAKTTLKEKLSKKFEEYRKKK